MTNLNNNTDLQNLLKKVEELVLDQNFRKAAAKTAKQFGCSLSEWNENKMPIIYKMAYQYVINN